MHVQNHMHMAAHNRKCVNTGRKNVAQFQNARFQPHFTVFKLFFAVGIKSTQPRAAHAAVNQVKKLCLSGVDKLAAWLGHRRGVDWRAFCQHRIRRNFGSDLSEGRLRRDAAGFISGFKSFLPPIAFILPMRIVFARLRPIKKQ